MPAPGRHPTRPSGDVQGWRAVDGWLRRAFVVALAVFVGLGVFGLFGAKRGSAIAEGGGYRLSVRYASVTRPGLGAEWKADVSRSDGGVLPDRVTLTASAPYFELFDENSLDPQPVSESVADGTTWWTFSVPPGATTLEVSFDAFVDPDVHRGRRGRAAVVADGREAVAVAYETRVAG